MVLYLKVPEDCRYTDMWYFRLLGIQSGICWAVEYLGESMFNLRNKYRDEFEKIYSIDHDLESYLCTCPAYYIGANMYEDCFAPRIVYLQNLLEEYENKQISSPESAWCDQAQQRND